MKSHPFIFAALIALCTLSTLSHAAPPQSRIVYENDFTQSAGPEWSEAKISKTHTGKRPYLGNIGSDRPLVLTLKNLPDHKMLRLTFDLFLTRPWNGSSVSWGCSQWDLSLAPPDGRSLLHTSFSNCGFFTDNNEQAFPDAFPARPHPAWTLAEEHETLGVHSHFWRELPSFDCSSVYHLVLTFPHDQSDVSFLMRSTLEKDQLKFFGVTNVKVETLTEIETCIPEEMLKLWTDLGSDDPKTFWTAQWKLIATGDAAVKLIGDHLDDRIDLPDKEIRRLAEIVASVDNPDAKRRLLAQGRRARESVDSVLSWEDMQRDARTRLQYVRRLIIRDPETPTELRLHRARRILEAVHTPAAVALQKKIPDMAPKKKPVQVEEE